VPLASHIAGLGAVRTHFAAFFFSGWVLTHGITEAIVQLGTTMAGDDARMPPTGNCSREPT
jgi:hypothetical protein